MILAHAGGRAPRPGGAQDWAYLGHEAGGLFRWSKRLGSSWRRLDLSRDIAASADALRQAYSDWIDGLAAAHADQPDWWTTQVSEKNAFASPLFFQLCALHALRERAEKGTLPGLLVCDSWELLLTARAVLRSSGEPVRAPGLAGAGAARALDAAKLAARLVQLAARSAGSLVRGKSGSPPAASRPEALIVTYVHEDSISPEGVFKDRYMPGLREELERAGYAVRLLAKPLDTTLSRGEVVRRMRLSPDGFIVPDDYLRLSDYARALRGSLRCLFLPRSAPPLKGLDASVLLRAERWRQARSVEGFQARLTRSLLPRLREAGFALRLIVSWFENQKDDKALALGIREAFPSAEHVGYLSLLPNPNYLTVFPTKTEARGGALPARLVCCGRHQERLMRAGSALPVSIGPALRYGYLRSTERGAGAGAAALVVLPSRLWEAAELLAALEPVLRLETGVERWLIKGHPDYTLEELRAYIDPSVFDRMRLLDRPLARALDEAAVVVAAGSGAAVEAACLGLPVVLVGRLSGLDFNPLAWHGEVASVCRTAEATADALRGALSLTPDRRAALKELGGRLCSDCFEPVGDRSMSAFTASTRQGLLR